MPSPLEIALNLIGREINPVPIKFMEKVPSTGKGWQTVVITAETAPQYFNGNKQNVGAQMGAHSRGLTDVDQDCLEAIAVAPLLLPKTDCIFGRKSKPNSHYEYITDLAGSIDKAAITFDDPCRQKNARLVELRIGGGGAGAQTVFPGSVHASGEQVEWTQNGRPAKVAGNNLLISVQRVAVAALLARYWPDRHSELRHEAALSVGGFLARAGLNEDAAATMLKAIAIAAHDEEPDDRAQAAHNAGKRLAQDKPTRGLPAMIAMFGEPVALKCAEWLNYETRRETKNSETEETESEFVISAKPHVFTEEVLLAPRDFLYGSHIQRGTVSLSAGLGAVGKSSKSIVEKLAMATGKPLLGIQPAKPLRVLLINLEDNRPELDRRIAAAMKHYGLTPADVGNRLITIAKGELTFKIARQVRMGEIAPDEPAINGMIKYLLENAIDVVSIDPLRKTHRVSENDNTAMGEVIECFERIAETANCAAHIWHHNRKSNAGETTVDSARGAVALIDAPRSVELLETMTTEMADKFCVRSERRRYYFRTFNGKVNFAPPIEESMWFETVSIILDNGDNVGVVTRFEPPEGKDYLTPEAIAAIKIAVSKGEWREDVRAGMWVGKAIGQVLKLDLETKKGLIKKVLVTLFQTGVLKVEPGKDQHRNSTLFVEVA